MNKLIQNIWFLAGVALVLNVGVTMTVLFGQLGNLLESEMSNEHKDAVQAENHVFWTFHTREINALIEEIEEQYASMARRRYEIEGLEARLQAEREEIARARKEVADARSELSRLIVSVKEEELKNLKTLAKTYATLSPEAVVAVFDEMDDEFVVKVLSLMKPDSVGPIWEQMAAGGRASQADRVARLSEMLRMKAGEGLVSE